MDSPAGLPTPADATAAQSSRRKSDVTIERRHNGHAMLRMRLPTERLKDVQTSASAALQIPKTTVDGGSVATAGLHPPSDITMPPSSPGLFGDGDTTIETARAGGAARQMVDVHYTPRLSGSGASTPLGGGDRSALLSGGGHGGGGGGTPLIHPRKKSQKKKASRSSAAANLGLDGEDGGGVNGPGSGASTPLIPGGSELTRQNVATLKTSTSNVGGRGNADTASNTGTATALAGDRTGGGGVGTAGGNPNSEQLRLLDRSGRPCRKWQIKPHRVHTIFGSSFRTKIWSGADPTVARA